MKVLGIESTAHTIGIGIVDTDGAILADARKTFKPEKGGIMPRKAADFIAKNSFPVLKEALKKAGLKLKDIDAFAYSKGPGLGACLRISSSIARYLSIKYDKPLLGVNHCIGHIEIAKLLTEAEDPVVLYCSGGNTQVIALAGGRYRVFGETLDIAVGNCLDSVARTMGLKHPGGPKIEKLAKKSKNYIELPYTVKGMDLSFTGLATACRNKYKEGEKKEEIAYSLQETAFAMLTEVTERAMAHTEKEEVIVTGGVAANSRFKEMIKIMAEERKANFYTVPKEYSGDNGTMIAWTGALMLKAGIETKFKESKVDQKYRTDEVDIEW